MQAFKFDNLNRQKDKLDKFVDIITLHRQDSESTMFFIWVFWADRQTDWQTDR